MTHSFLDHESNSRVYPVEVFKLKENFSRIFRLLSNEYGGCLTHWYKGRTEYCCGQDCHGPKHQIKQIWYGYCPTEVWVPDLHAWQSTVLQITSSLELDMRERFARGQVWEITRPIQTEKKKPPVFGKLLEQLDVNTIPQPFDIIPILKHVFREKVIRLDTPNHLPARTILPVTKGIPPRSLQALEDSPPIATVSELRNRLKDAGLLNNNKNGKLP